MYIDNAERVRIASSPLVLLAQAHLKRCEAVAASLQPAGKPVPSPLRGESQLPAK